MNDQIINVNGGKNMNNELRVFNNQEFGTIRTVVIDNEPWFVGKDVAEALGYSNSRKAIDDHVDKEDRQIIQKSRFVTLEIPTRGLTVINESGLYSLILSSKLPTAKQFKHWVTSEVLPSVRKRGIYATMDTIEQILSNPDYGIRLLTELKNEREMRKELEEKNSSLTLDNKALAGKILEWKDRDKLNAGMRKLASVTGAPFWKVWNDLYKQLEYKYGICPKRRGGSPYIQHIKENEWEMVVKSFSAICEAYNQSPSKMLDKVSLKNGNNVINDAKNDAIEVANSGGTESTGIDWLDLLEKEEKGNGGFDEDAA